METVLLAGLVLVAVAACPLMAWVQRRRGRAGCCAPARTGRQGRAGAPADQDLAAVEAERARVGEQIRALEQDAGRSTRAG